jgi:hypothetical protein
MDFDMDPGTGADNFSRKFTKKGCALKALTFYELKISLLNFFYSLEY